MISLLVCSLNLKKSACIDSYFSYAVSTHWSLVLRFWSLYSRYVRCSIVCALDFLNRPKYYYFCSFYLMRSFCSFKLMRSKWERKAFLAALLSSGICSPYFSASKTSVLSHDDTPESSDIVSESSWKSTVFTFFCFILNPFSFASSSFFLALPI